MQHNFRYLSFYLSGKDIGDSIRLLLDSGLFEKEPPSSLQIDYDEVKVEKDWLAHLLEATEQEAIIRWDQQLHQKLKFYPGNPQLIWVSLEREISWSLLFSTLENVPFALASFDTLYPEWGDIDPGYVAPSFSNGHYPHGWACAIKGSEGHGQLVSRRWLDYGPWEMARGSNDLSFILFHSLGADAVTALAQARPGHRHMGITDEGGFVYDDYIFEYTIKGRYLPESRILKVIIHGANLSPRELLDYSAARRFQTLKDASPLERIGFVFMEKVQAEKYVETLWLRDMECYAIDGGNEVRLDENFKPPLPGKPW